MIEFKIISAPDKSQQAAYQHAGKELVIGREEGDMLIDDPALSPRQLRIFFNGNQAMVENLDLSQELRLNGKSVSGATPIKEKDNMTVARTTINIVKADLSAIKPPPPFDNPNAKERFSPGSKESAILEVLSHLEKEARGASGGGSPPLPGRSAPPPLPGGGPKPPTPPKPPIPKK